MQILDVEMNEEAFIGETLNANVLLTKSGTEDMCLVYEFTKGIHLQIT